MIKYDTQKFREGLRVILEGANKITEHSIDNKLVKMNNIILLISLLTLPLSSWFIIPWLSFGVYTTVKWAFVAHHELLSS